MVDVMVEINPDARRAFTSVIEVYILFCLITAFYRCFRQLSVIATDLGRQVGEELWFYCKLDLNLDFKTLVGYGGTLSIGSVLF